MSWKDQDQWRASATPTPRQQSTGALHAVQESARDLPLSARLTDAGEALFNNLIWLIMFQVAIPIGLALAVLLNQNHFVVRLMKPTFFFHVPHHVWSIKTNSIACWLQG